MVIMINARMVTVITPARINFSNSFNLHLSLFEARMIMRDIIISWLAIITVRKEAFLPDYPCACHKFMISKSGKSGQHFFVV